MEGNRALIIDGDAVSPEEIRRQVTLRYRWYLVLVGIVSVLVGWLVGTFSAPSYFQVQDDSLQPPDDWSVVCDPKSLGQSTPLNPAVTASPLHIYVSGAVTKAQVITLPAGSLVYDALAAVGGVAADADLESLNLAAPLVDHQQIVVPFQPSVSAPPVDTAALSSSRGGIERLDINLATAGELETLPHIGPTLAARIIAYRELNGPFSAIADIQNVPGIGPSIFAEISPLITLNP